jgi:DNA (cytosine-5)-methyltransferase 1
VPPPQFSVAGLFAGIGGIERGFELAGGHAELLCEYWDPAVAVLRNHWPDVPLHPDVRTLRALPDTDVVTAGFPCQDLSQAGRTAGITGQRSGLVGEVFRLLGNSRGKARPRWLVLENVRNMLFLDGGRAMRFLVGELEALGFRWAYRLVDSRSAGVPQRRQRVLMVASRDEDPLGALFADDAGEPAAEECYSADAYGFYWTEGGTGLGWAQDAVPTLKGGSGLGIPSPPAVWIPGAAPGRAVVTPSIADAEALQGFPRGWTFPAQPGSRRNSPRWTLVGNAVTVGVAHWLGTRLAEPGEPTVGAARFAGRRWPNAAWGANGTVWVPAEPVSMWPVARGYTHLLDVLDLDAAVPLSHRAATGFLSRAARSSLRFDPDFLHAVQAHARHHATGHEAAPPRAS